MNEMQPFVNRTIAKIGSLEILELARAQVGQRLVVKLPTVTHHPIRVIEDDGHVFDNTDRVMGYGRKFYDQTLTDLGTGQF